jgi:hypothetical protein
LEAVNHGILGVQSWKLHAYSDENHEVPTSKAVICQVQIQSWYSSGKYESFLYTDDIVARIIVITMYPAISIFYKENVCTNTMLNKKKLTPTIYTASLDNSQTKQLKMHIVTIIDGV